MSFIRFSENSDLYIYPSYLGFIECCGCRLYGTFEAKNLESLLEHVGEHRSAGHNVPSGFEDQLKDMVEDSDFIPEGKAKVTLDAPWLNDLVNLLSGQNSDVLAKAVETPQVESILEQHIRLAVENVKKVVIRDILDKHALECDNSSKSCTHLEDVKIIEEMQ